MEIYVAQTEGFFAPRSPGSRDQIPSPAVSPENALRNSNRNFSETTIFIVFSCFFGPVFEDGPKTRKNHHAESATIRGRFRGGRFLYKFPFLSNFYLAPLAHSDPRTVLKPLFLLCFPVFSVQNFPSPRTTPSRYLHQLSGFWKFWPQKRAKK